MVNFAAKNKHRFIIFGLFLLFFIISGSCLILSGDDLWWCSIPTLSDFLDNYKLNGRFLTNVLSYLSCHNTVFCVVLYVLTFTGFYASAGSLLGSNYKYKWLPYASMVLIFLFAQKAFYSQIINWVSGYTNYVISLILLFIYINYTKPVFDRKKPEGGLLTAVVFLIVGFLGALCVENITIYNIIFGIFVIVFSLVVRKRVTAANITYLIGTVIGTIFMFWLFDYGDIASNGDTMGFRGFEFTFEDIATKLYLEIIPYYACCYSYLHLIISAALLYIYFKRFQTDSKKPKYAKICIPVIVFYCIYSFASLNLQQLVIMSNSYKVRAFECALAFIYVISLLYIVYHLLSGAKRVMSMIYLVSTIIVTGQFIVISPITLRCFFADYIFWCLFAFSLLMEAVYVSGVRDNGFIRSTAIVFIASVLGIISFFNITNKYVDNLRIDFVKEQLTHKQKNVEFIRLPYAYLSGDTAEMLDSDVPFIQIGGEKWMYSKAYYVWNGIDLSVLDRVRVDIEMMDYNLSKE